MQYIHTFTELEELLTTLRKNELSRHRTKSDRMIQLMDFLGNPQNTYKVIHVAGTSGKTSTAYYVAALLKEAGLKVGLTVSPHVDTVNERVQLDLTLMPEAVFCQRFNLFLDAIELSGIVPSYFEAFIAFAFWEFAQQKVDYAVVEVGIGGLADSTNVVGRDDKVCVITDIGYDHMKVLGDTLAEIAAQKAGIIQLHNIVFCYRQTAEIMEAIYKRSEQKHADLHILDEKPMGYPFLPIYQRRNFVLADNTVQAVLERDGLSLLTKQQKERAARHKIMARMEMRHHVGKTIVLDAAHNSQKMRAFVRSIQAKLDGAPLTVVLAIHLEGSRFVSRLVHELRILNAYIIVTSFPPDATGRFGSADPYKVFDAVANEIGAEKAEVIEDPAAAFAAALQRQENTVAVTGSFYLLNHIRPLL